MFFVITVALVSAMAYFAAIFESQCIRPCSLLLQSNEQTTDGV
jgi:hypothetical protein